MPRLPFNTTCSVYRGPSHPDAGDLVGVFDCRLVLENGIQQFAGQPNRLGWITIEVYAVEHGWSDDPISYDPLLADRIAIPDDAAEPQYQVWYADVINWKTQAEYDRLNVIAAIPAPPPEPGESCPDALAVEFDVEYGPFDLTDGSHWYIPPVPESGPIRVQVSITGVSLGLIRIWQGDDCESLGMGPSQAMLSDGDYCLDSQSLGPPWRVEIENQGSTASYTVTFSAGSCP